MPGETRRVSLRRSSVAGAKLPDGSKRQSGDEEFGDNKIVAGQDKDNRCFFACRWRPSEDDAAAANRRAREDGDDRLVVVMQRRYDSNDSMCVMHGDTHKVLKGLDGCLRVAEEGRIRSNFRLGALASGMPIMGGATYSKAQFILDAKEHMRFTAVEASEDICPFQLSRFAERRLASTYTAAFQGPQRNGLIPTRDR